MEFKEFKQAVQRQFNTMVERGPIFQAKIDKDEIWNLYLSSYPEGTNPVFRERTEHDCSCCRSFVKQAGGMVQIVDGKLTSIWDLQVEGEYQVVADALAEYAKSVGIENVFLHTEGSIGTDRNHENLEPEVRTWEHFHVTLPNVLKATGTEIGPRRSEYQAMHDVVLRSLVEITKDAVETVQDLIAQNSLYRGEEKKRVVDAFATMRRGFTQASNQDIYAWSQVVGTAAFVCKIRNDVIGTLLVDLSEGMDLEVAVKRFEDKVSGTNYQRPTALVTPKMRDTARKQIEEMGLMSALDRRFAKLEDISVTNVLFADRSVRTRMGGDVFDSIATTGIDVKKLDKTEEVSIDKFIADILPTAQSIEVFVENRHSGNLVSLVAPCDLTAKSLFKWKNPFSWSYSGDVADSIKERVKAAGGNVTGEVCCRLAWDNNDDLDFHMVEPDRHTIYYSNRGQISRCGGKLDVDANGMDGIRPNPCENIFYESMTRMKAGKYSLKVHQYAQRQSVNVGFEAQIDILGTIHRFSYPKALRDNDKIHVADIIVSPTGIEVVPFLPSSQASKELWGLKTQNFQPVTAVMLSPNHWDGEGVGNKHFFFMLAGCQSDGSARGFYNEFLKGELEPHRKTMEMVGSKTRTEDSGDQMSGLGFSSTQRNNVIVRVTGSFSRTIKIVF